MYFAMGKCSESVALHFEWHLAHPLCQLLVVKTHTIVQVLVCEGFLSCGRWVKMRVLLGTGTLGVVGFYGDGVIPQERILTLGITCGAHMNSIETRCCAPVEAVRTVHVLVNEKGEVLADDVVV